MDPEKNHLAFLSHLKRRINISVKSPSVTLKG
jgi:hypothetical protein